MTPEERRLELGRLIKVRRGVRNLDLLPAARQVGMGKDTWTKVEEGGPVTRPSVYARIERVLDWPSGSISRYLNGGPEPMARDDELVLYQPTPGATTSAVVTRAVAERLALQPDRGQAEIDAAVRAAVEHTRRSGEAAS